MAGGGGGLFTTGCGGAGRFTTRGGGGRLTTGGTTVDGSPWRPALCWWHKSEQLPSAMNASRVPGAGRRGQCDRVLKDTHQR
jgi:hypothetical protein